MTDFPQLTDEQADAPRGSGAEFYLGTVTEVSSSSGVKIQLDGQTAAMTKGFKMLRTGIALSAGYRVLVIKLSGTYIVLGRVALPSS